MKRLTLSFLTLCFALMITAEPVGKQTALYTAQAYMLAKGKNINATQTPFKATRKGATQTTGNEEDAYYYVFNAGGNGGYVIISGDDRTEPILGYVEQGSFDSDNIPENMRSLLQGYADEIKYIIDNNIQPNSPLLKKRNKVSGTKHSVGEMLTTRWNQGSPYNILCPKYYKKEDGTQHFPATGCTATAMAQLMYFYRYPEKTKAAIPAHSNTYTYTDAADGNQTKTTTVSVKAIPRNTVIDWDNMRDTYSWNGEANANVQDTAVARLMLMCGQSVKMGWGPSSGANFSAEAYINYFGYASGAYVGERYNYNIDDWFDAIYNEIDQGYPVLISGFSSGGGHAFVIDGFDGDNLFHLNWGWGGGSNGWFLVGILNPGDNSGIGASSSSDGYSMSQRALFNLRVPGAAKNESYLTISDVSITETSIKAKFTNRTGSTGSFHTGVVMLNEDGSLSLVGSKLTISGMTHEASASKTFKISDKLPEGTYRLSPASKSSKSEVWHPEYDFKNQYIETVVDSLGNANMQFKKPVLTGESISIDTITFPGTRIAGKEQEIKVTFRNNGAEYYREIRLFASKTDSNPTRDNYSESRSIVAVRSGETVDVSYFFTPEETGTYNLWFCTGSDGNGQVGNGTMEVITEAEASKANLSVSSYTITNLVSGYLYGKHLVGRAAIKNNNRTEDFNGRIRLQIWNQPNSSGSAWGGTSQTYEVNILAGKIANVEFSFDGLNENNKYYISASYVNQDGSLGNGGVWDLGGWEMRSGIALWKNNGDLTGKAYSSSISITASMCGVYADCNKKINRMTPNKNPNTIYAFGAGMEIPATLENSNAVSGKHANHINLYSDEPYYLPATFRADSASYTYTFPETEVGTGWHAFTMPFEADSIFIDDIPVSLEDTLNHFWIYEFSAQSINGEVVFAPAKKLHGGTPYIIAGDSKMAGRSIVFRSLDVPFYKTGTDKMVVTSWDYKFHGNTYSPRVKDCYVLNAEGTAFEYVTALTALDAQASYFTTSLSTEEMPDSIVLPAIPASPERNITLDETSSEAFAYGIYDNLTLKRTFEVGWNTVCLPFEVKNVEAFFGEGSKAYEVLGLVEGELDCCPVDSLAPSLPYIIYVPEAITDDFILSDIHINPANTTAGFVQKYGVHMIGRYKPEYSDMFSMELRKLNADGTFAKFGPDEVMNGFRALFSIPSDEEVTLHLYDDPTGITSLKATTERKEIYNLAGQRLNRASKGINIIDGKKVLR